MGLWDNSPPIFQPASLLNKALSLRTLCFSISWLNQVAVEPNFCGYTTRMCCGFMLTRTHSRSGVHACVTACAMCALWHVASVMNVTVGCCVSRDHKDVSL